MGLFGKRKDENNVRRKDLNRLITDVEEFAAPEDIDEIFRRLNRIQLFIPVESANFDLSTGKKPEPGEELRVKFSTVCIQGQNLLLFHVNRDDPRLGEHYAGMSVAEAFDFIERSPELGGLVFYNNGESYFEMRRENFSAIRRLHLY